MTILMVVDAFLILADPTLPSWTLRELAMAGNSDATSKKLSTWSSNSSQSPAASTSAVRFSHNIIPTSPKKQPGSNVSTTFFSISTRTDPELTKYMLFPSSPALKTTSESLKETGCSLLATAWSPSRLHPLNNLFGRSHVPDHPKSLSSQLTQSFSTLSLRPSEVGMLSEARQQQDVRWQQPSLGAKQLKISAGSRTKTRSYPLSDVTLAYQSVLRPSQPSSRVGGSDRGGTSGAAGAVTLEMAVG
mmetsp:Transcript_31571/g.100977  ORF Transcript_31571/g.100977 Transcript_31571/m.100977 type:complete len:246 (+) Transcript_31571:740-1477(+)